MTAPCNDSVTLELVATQKEQFAAMAELRDKGAANWTAEETEKWEGLNTQYNATLAAKEERAAKLAKQDQVNAQMAAMEAALKSSTMPAAKARGLLIGGRDDEQRGGAAARFAFDADGGGDPGEPTQADYVLAVQAWMMAQNRRGKRITERHRQACAKVGHDPTEGEMEVRLDFQYGNEPAWAVGQRQMLRTGRYEERVGMDTITAGAGMETIPQGFMAELERRLMAFGGPRSACRVIRTTTGNALPWPTIDDTGNTGVLLPEATTIGASVDPVTAAVVFNDYKFSSKPVLVSAELIEDSAFNLAQEIGALLGERLGRITGQYTTTGTGVAQPKGIVTCAVTFAAGGAGAIAPDDLIKIQHAVDPAYRTGTSVGYMMHDDKVGQIRLLKDSQNRYIWQEGLSAGVPNRIAGYPYTINQHMASGAPAAAQKSVIFGDLSKFIVRDIASVRFYRLDERYRDTDQTGFVSFMRLDSNCIQPNAIKILLH